MYLRLRCHQKLKLPNGSYTETLEMNSMYKILNYGNGNVHLRLEGGDGYVLTLEESYVLARITLASGEISESSLILSLSWIRGAEP